MNILHFSASEQGGISLPSMEITGNKRQLVNLMRAHNVAGEEVPAELNEISSVGRWSAARVYTTRLAMGEAVSVHFLPDTEHLGPLHVELTEAGKVFQFALERLARDDLGTLKIPDDQEYLAITGPSHRHLGVCLHELIAYVGEHEIPLLDPAQPPQA